MELKSDQIRLVFGMKLKRLRTAKGLSLAELSSRTGLSASYLNEIEKGRKYPKAERITPLAAALGTTYDKLVSLKLDKQLTPISDILNNELLQELPLDLFGIDRIKLMSVLGNAPAKAAAFIKTLSRIAGDYNVTEEHFYFAALRSHQELHENHFDETEEAVIRFRERFELRDDDEIGSAQLRQLLQERFNCTVEERSFTADEELSHMRSIYIPELRKLLVNARLAENQKAFLFAKEL
ncbi:MAG TPA: helix-turn-helix domain-containing protein, partial [Flavobacteriales bacterium]